MSKGTIKFFNAQKGFGFITADEGGKDVFLPATALADIDPARLSPGRRVAFKPVPDPKGPKASQILLLDEAAGQAAAVDQKQKAIVYCDPSAEASKEVLHAIGQAGFAAQVVDYVSTPMSHDQLRRLSLPLGEAGQSLVRRFDPLFLALQLDDRFMGEHEFWTGVSEHPALINGPILALSGKVQICKSAREAKAFLTGGGARLPEKPAGLSPRLLALLRGEQIAAVTASAKRGEETQAAVAKGPAKAAGRKEGGTAGKERAVKGAATGKKPGRAAAAGKKKKPAAAHKPASKPAARSLKSGRRRK